MQINRATIFLSIANMESHRRKLRLYKYVFLVFRGLMRKEIHWDLDQILAKVKNELIQITSAELRFTANKIAKFQKTTTMCKMFTTEITVLYNLKRIGL